MAPRTARPPARPLWELLEQMDAELQQAILSLVGAAGAKNLRLASRAARALANSRVEGITLSVDDVLRLPLRLRERFPRLQSLAVQADPDGALSPDAFVAFAVTELAHLPLLVGLDLHGCKSLDTAAALALREYSPQLEGLHLQDTGVAGPATLQLLASLTRLTSLDLSGTAVAAGLRHLTRLKGLASLGLTGCKGVEDEHLQPLSALTGLTTLDAWSTGIQGGSLAGLISLQHLNIHSCSSMGAAALAAVVQLTRLTFLDVGYTATEAGPAQLAQLAQLTSLQELRLWGHTIRQQAAALLELPRLGMLCADSIAVPPGQDLSPCAITRLVLWTPAAADLRALPQLPALQSLVISTPAASVSGIRAQAQLTELVVGDCRGVQGAELATALRGLQQVQVLELSHAGCFDRQCLVAVAGMRQLRELWLDGGRQRLAPGLANFLGMLNRCTQLQRVTLQRCGPTPLAALSSLVGGHPSMQRVALRGSDHGLTAEAAGDLRALGATFACELLSEEVLCAGPRSDEFFVVAV